MGPPKHLKKLLSKEQRAWERIQCKYITECSDSSGTQWACKVIDISGNGLGIFSSASLSKGETVSVADPKVNAVVVWVSASRMGLHVCN